MFPSGHQIQLTLFPSTFKKMADCPLSGPSVPFLPHLLPSRPAGRQLEKDFICSLSVLLVSWQRYG